MSSIPSNVQVLDLPDGVHYVLPARDVGPLRWFGAVPVLFGLMMMAIPTFFVWKIFNPQEQFTWIFASVFTLVALLIGSKPVTIGLLIIFGHSEIKLTGEKLIAIERWGLIRRKRQQPVANIQKLQLVRSNGKALPESDNTASTVTPSAGGLNRIGELASLVARLDKSKITGNQKQLRRDLRLAVGYPTELLRPLAIDLSERCSHQYGVTLLHDHQHIDVHDTSMTEYVSGLVNRRSEPVQEADNDENALQQPMDSKVRVDWNDAGFTMHVPPAGLRKGSKGLFTFGVIWCVFVGVFTGGIIFNGAWDDMIIGLLITSLFWVIGIGMLLAGINMGRRQAIIDVIGDTLLITRKGIFGTKQNEWQRDQIKAIRVDNSGMEVNNKPVKNLQIHLNDAKEVGLFSERSDDELYWIAALLRTTLGLPSRSKE